MASAGTVSLSRGMVDSDIAKGFSLIESLVAIILSLLLTTVCIAAAAVVRANVEDLIGQRDHVEVERVVTQLLTTELRGVRPGIDWEAPGGDSLSLRAFRGWALLCPIGDFGEVLAATSGIRMPDPQKDSVLVLGPGGVWVPARLVRRNADEGRCGPSGGRVERWELDPPVQGSVARYYERGSYHLSDGALRYRRGRGGRQPLTAQSLDRTSFLRAGGSSDLELGLFSEDPGSTMDPTGSVWNAAPGR
jgi:hypothetical protein